MDVKDVLDGIVQENAVDNPSESLGGQTSGDSTESIGLTESSILLTDPGDYIGEDGLLYCGNCHTRKQRSIFWPLSGKEMVVSVLCRCGEECKEREEAENRRKEEMDRIKRAKGICIHDRALLECTFERMTAFCHS